MQENFYVKSVSQIYISFDVGIKNLAYCILKFDGENNFNIIDWNCINLLEDLEKTPEICKCSHLLPCKKNSSTSTACEKKAYYSTKNNSFFCKKHIPENYILPEKEFSPAFIKKQKIAELLKLYENVIGTTGNGLRRAELLEKVIQYYDNKQLKKIIVNKKINSKHISLITIGEKLKIELDKIIFSNHLSNEKIIILIENQISTIASRMTSIQAMIIQYFISGASTLSSEKKIELVSSKNKLKYSIQETNENVSIDVAVDITVDVDDPIKQEGNTYKNNKKNGILFCKNILEKNKMNEYISFFQSNKKKDDLADCFLQGYYVANRGNKYLSTK